MYETIEDIAALDAQVAERAAASGISPGAARLLITGKLRVELPQDPVSSDVLAARAGTTEISPATASLLMAPTAQGLGMLATAVKPIRQ
jgi:hypothetical protein